jgi:hypothetical protein
VGVWRNLKEKAMGKLTEQIDIFDAKLKTQDGTKRTPTDNDLAQLSFFLLELSRRIDKIVDEDVEM